MPNPSPPPWPERLRQHAETMPESQRPAFLEQVSQVDWDLVASLVDRHVVNASADSGKPDSLAIEPAEFVSIPTTDEEIRDRQQAEEIGEGLLRKGAVGVLIVAGGQGSRLGFEGPKGTYPIGAVTGASLFRFHARKVLALSRQFGRPVPLLIMTSPENDQTTKAHFAEHEYFGLSPEHVRFFSQGQLPAVDVVTGEPLFTEPGRLALAPDGHGGSLYALSRVGKADGRTALEWLESWGADTLFYFQVDNPLVKIAEPAFLGMHHREGAQVSFKVVAKSEPGEKVGVVCSLPDGRKCVIEYSDLPTHLAERRDAQGRLAFRAGSIAVHVFRTDFLRELASGTAQLPFHKALKKVPFWDFDRGEKISPGSPNAVKFEAFIFDTLPMARKSLIVETDRRTEFEPLKNATGPDSPETVRAAMSRIAADTLEELGISAPRDEGGRPLVDIELDPCLEAHPERILQMVGPGRHIERPVSLNDW